jgi:hypothetical protein
MPTYRFLDTETNEEFEEFVTIDRKTELLEKNPHIQQLPTGFAIVSAVGGVDSKTDSGWKEVLSKVAEAHPESDLGGRYGSKSIKQIKTQNAVNKHLGRWRNL